MAIVKWKNRSLYDPWSEMKTLQDEINSLFNDDRLPSTAGLFDRNVSPAMDVVENENQFMVSFELPGLEQKNVDLTVSSNILTVKGDKTETQEKKKGKFFRKETWSGSFQRTLSLPPTVDSAKINAEFEDGILRIFIPKKDEAKTKQITVNIK